MATSIQAQQRRPIPAASPSDSISNTTTIASSAQIKRVVKPNVRSASSDTNKVSSSDQNRHLPNPIYRKPTKRSPPHESLRYVKKAGQNERNCATQNHEAAVSSGHAREATTRTARRTSLSRRAKTAATPTAKPGQERASKASKPGKIHQLYVKKTTPLSNGKETRDAAASGEISKGVALDPVLHADDQKTKQEEGFVKEMKRVEPIEKEVTIPTETVAEAEKALVEVSEQRKKAQMPDISTESENQIPEAEKKNEAKWKEREAKEEKESERSREEPEEEEMKKTAEAGKSRDEERESGSSGKKECPAGYNEMIEETASRLLEERKNKVKALVGAFETVIDAESAEPSN